MIWKFARHHDPIMLGNNKRSHKLYRYITKILLNLKVNIRTISWLKLITARNTAQWLLLCVLLLHLCQYQSFGYFLGGCGWLLVVVDSCGWLRMVVGGWYSLMVDTIWKTKISEISETYLEPSRESTMKLFSWFFPLIILSNNLNRRWSTAF